MCIPPKINILRNLYLLSWVWIFEEFSDVPLDKETIQFWESKAQPQPSTLPPPHKKNNHNFRLKSYLTKKTKQNLFAVSWLWFSISVDKLASASRCKGIPFTSGIYFLLSRWKKGVRVSLLHQLLLKWLNWEQSILLFLNTWQQPLLSPKPQEIT